MPDLNDFTGDAAPRRTGSFFRSSHCKDGPCVEVADTADGPAVRDSKDVDGPVLRFTRAEWKAFVLGVRDGEFDLF
ncbi:DUF397 domain-containing protein [Saccharothrix australiensis]|uniref:Uncharacterized protein DUF397 n=1 Tax=Saccharothrix australiensis TaxID=2072 RepID=A0A495VY56_9PSEU|nr:DUF397 domain-containing protein [Saccharothrix australiensis]RKT54256.1 uncharacterized protein DUF397 [Saccharothrix australiensis]